jgi:hypothetical protein
MESFKLSVKNDLLYKPIMEQYKQILSQDTAKITLADVAAGLEKIYKEINGYKDGELKEYYAGIENDSRAFLIKEAIKEAASCHEVCSHNDFIEIIRTAIKKMMLKREEDQKTTAAGRVINIPEVEVQQRVDRATDHYEELFYHWIDARILHRVARSTSNTIFVCAGGGHIEGISQELPKLGYALKKSKGGYNDIETEEDIRNIIENQSIDIGEYFDLDCKMKEPNPVLQPKRFSYLQIFCAAAVTATLSYLGYRYYQRVFAKH